MGMAGRDRVPAAITGKEDTGVNAGSQNYSRSETRTSTVEVKAEAQARKIRKTEVPADVEQLPEEIKIISEERIGDKHRARAAEWLQELQVNGYFLDSEEGEYDRRVNYINEARTAKQLAAVMDDLPPVPAARKYHGTMAPGADRPTSASGGRAITGSSSGASASRRPWHSLPSAR